MPALLILIPLLGVLLLNLPLRKDFQDKLALWFGLAFCVAQAVLVLCSECLTESAELDFLLSALNWSPLLDGSSRIMLLSISIVGFSALMLARYCISSTSRLFVFCNLLLLAIASMNGLALVNDLFSLYIFLEVTSACSFILIAFDRDKASLEGAFKYFLLSALATAMLMAAIALFVIFAGGVSFTEVEMALRLHDGRPLMLLATGLFLCGLFIKGGLVPFHGWLPDAYCSAQPAASVLLAGIVTKAGGIFTLFRVLSEVFYWNDTVASLLLAFGIVSIVSGALGALGQGDFRRMLAYSSISQVGYIVLGLGAGGVLGMAGAMLHFFNHSIFKTLLFVNAVSLEKQTGSRDINQMGGLAQKMPVTSATSTIAFLSTAGIPPFSGFWSKLLIVLAVWQAGHYWLAAVAVLASLLTLAYFLSLTRRVFFGKLAAGFDELREASAWALIPALLLAAITIGLGIAMPWLFESFLLPIGTIL